MDNSNETQLAPYSWEVALSAEKEKNYFKKVMAFVKAERALGKTIYPPQKDIFNALKAAPFDQIKVVILGQDPYHGPNQAHGMCFSVQKGVQPPPSLVNIYKELHDDLGMPIPQHGCLQKWADQGVLLLNTVLTVERGKAHSHAGKGWEIFTDTIIHQLNELREGLIFILWGSHAMKKAAFIDPSKHFILKSPHPSPLSAHRGFFGCKHFSKTNQLLIKLGLSPIDWSI